jgi:hypothetical protein
MGGQVTADPVEAAMAEASRRFGVPLAWIRAVIRIESAGDRRAVSRAGAMGLMQLMSATYAELRAQYRLGPDPFAVRDNILAGTAYLRQMYDRYGSPGFLAAYNAGPGRWEDHLAGRRSLPAETVAYLARLGPVIGMDAPAATRAMSESTAPSPLAADIFARSEDREIRSEPSIKQRRVLAIIEANPVLVVYRDSLFATPSASSSASLGTMSGSATATDSPSVSGPNSEEPTSSAPHPLPLSGGLFVARRASRGDDR